MLNFLRNLIKNLFGNSSGCCKLPKNGELANVPQKGYFNQKSY